MIRLQGFVFFGTAITLLERIRERSRAEGAVPLRFLVLDLRRVTGVDSSAVLAFHRAADLGRVEGFEVIFTAVAVPDVGVPESLGERLRPYLERLDVPADHVQIRQDDQPNDVYLLESGRLRVEMQTHDGSRLRLGTMRAGVVVGEIALYTGTRRTADVVAEVPSTVLRLSRASLERMQQQEPALAAEVHRWFATVLADRLGETLRVVDALSD